MVPPYAGRGSLNLAVAPADNWDAMWIAEALLVVSFFVIGSARPTAQSDAVARRRGVEAENRRKRELIHQAEGDYATNNPRSERTYTFSIVTFFGGGVL